MAIINNNVLIAGGGISFVNGTYEFPKGYQIAIGSKTLDQVHSMGGIPLTLKINGQSNAAQYKAGTWQQKISGKELFYLHQNGGSSGYVDHNLRIGEFNLMVAFNCDWNTMKKLTSASITTSGSNGGGLGKAVCTCWLQPK